MVKQLCMNLGYLIKVIFNQNKNGVWGKRAGNISKMECFGGFTPPLVFFLLSEIIRESEMSEVRNRERKAAGVFIRHVVREYRARGVQTHLCLICSEDQQLCLPPRGMLASPLTCKAFQGGFKDFC